MVQDIAFNEVLSSCQGVSAYIEVKGGEVNSKCCALHTRATYTQEMAVNA